MTDLVGFIAASFLAVGAVLAGVSVYVALADRAEQRRRHPVLAALGDQAEERFEHRSEEGRAHAAVS